MKGIAVTIVCLTAGAWLANCGGGTLGDPMPTGGSGIIPTGGGARSGAGGTNAPAGGISGAAGRGSGGISGSLGSAGFGGSGFISCPVPAPVCGTLCGNGKRDTCIRASNTCQAQAWTEECDRDDFGADSCAARGFASGKLTCASDCTVSGDGCSECAPIGGSVIRCGPAPINAAPTGFNIAATDTEVGLVTFEYNNNGGTTLSFARLTPSLDLASAVPLEDTSQPTGSDYTSIYGVAVAPLSSGWVVTACGDPQVFIHLVDASGQEVARTVVDRVSNSYDACISGAMTLVPRPGGGPLLLWRSGSNLVASLIADDGRSAGAPQTIVGPTTFNSDTVGAAWIGDAFYVVAVIQRGAGDYSGLLRLVRLQPGAAPTRGDILVDDGVYSAPAVASGAAELRILYIGTPPGGVADQDYAVLWRKLGSSGEALSGPVVVGTFPDTFGTPQAVAFGGDTVVVLDSYYPSGQLVVERLASDGQIVTPAYDLVRTSSYYVRTFEVVRRGPDVVVGWLGNGLRLARVTP